MHNLFVDTKSVTDPLEAGVQKQGIQFANQSEDRMERTRPCAHRHRPLKCRAFFQHFKSKPFRHIHDLLYVRRDTLTGAKGESGKYGTVSQSKRITFARPLKATNKLPNESTCPNPELAPPCMSSPGKTCREKPQADLTSSPCGGN